MGGERVATFEVVLYMVKVRVAAFLLGASTISDRPQLGAHPLLLGTHPSPKMIKRSLHFIVQNNT